MLKIHLYGGLRRYASNSQLSRESVVRLEMEPGETVAALLERLGIPSAELCHVFLNGALLSTRNSMSPWLGYQEAGPTAPSSGQGLDRLLQPGDRLGVFGRDMALLVV